MFPLSYRRLSSGFQKGYEAFSEAEGIPTEDMLFHPIPEDLMEKSWLLAKLTQRRGSVVVNWDEYKVTWFNSKGDKVAEFGFQNILR